MTTSKSIFFLSLKKKQNKRDCQAENKAELISLKSDMRDYHMYVLKVTLTHHFLQALVTWKIPENYFSQYTVYILPIPVFQKDRLANTLWLFYLVLCNTYIPLHQQ